jgi:DNA-binding beta-propeller fold protein YncE
MGGRRAKRRALGAAGVVLALAGAGLIVGYAVAPSKGQPARPVPLVVSTLLKVPAASSFVQGGGGAWVTDDFRKRLIRFDPATGHTAGSVALTGRPVAIVLDGQDLWVANMVTNTLEEIRARDLHLLRTVSVPSAPSGLVALGGRIWVASIVASVISPVDPRTGVVGHAVALPEGAVRIAAGFGALWVTGTADKLTEIRLGHGATPFQMKAFTVGNGPIGVATGLGSVWVANAVAGTVVRIDPATRTIVHTFHVGGDPLTVAVAGGRVWVGDGRTHKLRTVFPAPGLGPVTLDSSPRALLTVGDHVWVATGNPGRVLSARVGNAG